MEDSDERLGRRTIGETMMYEILVKQKQNDPWVSLGVVPWTEEDTRNNLHVFRERCGAFAAEARVPAVPSQNGTPSCSKEE